MKTSQKHRVVGDVALPRGVRFLPGFLAEVQQEALYAEIERVVEAAPLYVPRMPGTGKPFSVEMTNCGDLGWVSDQSDGYRYQRLHPVSGDAWPAIPEGLITLWRAAGGYPAPPEACLVNFYRGKARLGSHRDSDEEDRFAPVVSVSLGDDAVFHVGGTVRSGPKARVTLRSGDVIVLEGASRFAYHGIDRIISGTSDLIAGGGRVNLTLRRVSPPGITR